MGKVVGQLLSEPQDLLATIVLGNTLANALIVGFALWMTLHAHWPLIASMGLTMVLILFGAEVTPKALAVRAPELWALKVARPMRVLQRASRPLRQIGRRVVDTLLRVRSSEAVPTTALSDAEYRELLEMACQQGALAAGEKEIILQIISLDRRQAKDVMTPRSRMACISDDLTVEEMLEAARKIKHRRLPMYDETPDTIVGVLNTRALLLNPEEDLSIAIELPSFVPASMNLLQLLKALQQQQRGLAIVLDEFGGTAGVVTIEDILAEVVGEFRRTAAMQGFVMEKTGPNRWRVSGSMRMDDFRREYPLLEEMPGVETMGGLAVRLMEVVPESGHSVMFSGLLLTAKVVEERRIKELVVRVARKRGL